MTEDMEHQKLEALTKILKKRLMIMMIRKWNGKDFTDLDDISGMADDILEVVSEIGNSVDD